ncbi:hypothetical protein LTR04_005577 [Oleoguttula sp. CCFEE 6159]|nr:hypothetical protein LTR04_005577 [Oleoguttula sp. CCFEE 6159]
MPPSLYGLDPRNPKAMDHVRMGVEGDYFGGGAPYGAPNFRARSPYGGPFEPDSHMRGPEYGVEEMVRRTNLAVHFANERVTHNMRYAQLHPAMCRDGRFPVDFRMPKTVEEVKVMDPSKLDRILQAYGLPADLRSLNLTSRDGVSTKRAQSAKLTTLYDSLGARSLAEHERRKLGLSSMY